MPRAKIKAKDLGYQHGAAGQSLDQAPTMPPERFEKYRAGWLQGRATIPTDKDTCPYCGEKPRTGWIMIDGFRVCGKHIDFNQFKDTVQ